VLRTERHFLKPEHGFVKKIGKILERYPGRTYEIVWKLGFGGNMTNLLAISIM
jgi:hypothetical protein